MQHLRRHGVARLLLWLSLLAAGCAERPLPAPRSAEPAPVVAGTQFTPATAGTIRGRVTWSGDRPRVPPFQVSATFPLYPLSKDLRPEPNPNAPAIDPATGGVRNAVVFLRGMEPARGRPFDQPPVRVEQRGRRLHVRQGETDSPVGFVRRGDAIEMVSLDETFHSLRAGGAAFFTLAFPDPHQPCTRRLEKNGVVELSSAAGYYWMRAYLFVDDHPYYARTDAQGRFELREVPPGRYDVVCWLPNWLEARHERDPESGLMSRLFFRAPVEQTRSAALEEKGAVDVDFSFVSAHFAKQRQ